MNSTEIQKKINALKGFHLKEKVEAQKDWTPAQLALAEALILNGLKSGHLEGVKRAVDMVGLPPVNEKEMQTIFQKAIDWHRFDELKWLIRTSMVPLSLKERVKWLKGFMIDGDNGDPSQKESWWQNQDISASSTGLNYEKNKMKDQTSPLGLCLKNDLGWVLWELIQEKDIEELLLSDEPCSIPNEKYPHDQLWTGLGSDGVQIHPDWKKLVLEYSALAEKSLMYTAIRLRAIQCVSVLSCIPAFAKILYDPDALWVPSCYSDDLLFENKNAIAIKETSAKSLKDDQRLNWSAWESLLNKTLSVGSHDLEKNLNGLHNVIKNAPHAIKTWKKRGNELGWVELYVSGIPIKQLSDQHPDLHKHIETLQVFKESDFHFQWDLLIQYAEKKHCSMLKEWLMMASVIPSPHKVSPQMRL